MSASQTSWLRVVSISDEIVTLGLVDIVSFGTIIYTGSVRHQIPRKPRQSRFEAPSPAKRYFMSAPTVLGITLGDPAGVGIEVTLKALSALDQRSGSRLLLIGEASTVLAQRHFAAEGTEIHVVAAIGECRWERGVINVMDMGVMTEPAIPGKLSAQAGEAAFLAVVRGIELALAGNIAGIVTGPLNKQAMHQAGHIFDGHTEILGHYCGRRPTYMLLSSKRLNIIHVSTHCSLREACDRAKKQRILDTIRAMDNHLKKMGAGRRKIGVAGLNPHAGENGLFGNEEISEIIPAINAAQGENIDAEGPVPPDTLYLKAFQGNYDAVVAMYHDQGHIPQKLVAFDEAVNITLGLPIIRTSVDHGTAFDIAGKGVGNPANMSSAIEYAGKMVS